MDQKQEPDVINSQPLSPELLPALWWDQPSLVPSRLLKAGWQQMLVTFLIRLCVNLVCSFCFLLVPIWEHWGWWQQCPPLIENVIKCFVRRRRRSRLINSPPREGRSEEVGGVVSGVHAWPASQATLQGARCSLLFLPPPLESVQNFPTTSYRAGPCRVKFTLWTFDRIWL